MSSRATRAPLAITGTRGGYRLTAPCEVATLTKPDPCTLRHMTAPTRSKRPPKWTPTELIAVLGEAYSRAPQRPSRAPVTELVLTLLSQHTSDHNSGRAMHQLLERFPTWDSVLDAPVEEVEDAIRPGGLAPTKSKRLQALLAEVKQRAPDWDLATLEELPLDEAKRWLTSLPGVGPKTAACVLLFALGRPALPVDTHIHRLAARWGLSDGKRVEKTERDLKAVFARKDWARLHLSMIYFGREHCPARGHDLSACPICGWAATRKRILEEARSGGGGPLSRQGVAKKKKR